MVFLIKAAQLLLSLSILIVLHEGGHFIAAKYFKTKVEKFYLFFNPWFSLFKIKKGETEYGMGWLPLGGYVKIAGMIDESMDKDQMDKEPEPWEFRSKPAWQRLIIMVGGVVVNVLLGFFIYSMTLFAYGEKYLPNENIKDGVWCMNETAKEMGFKTGDKIISVDGKKVEKFSGITERMLHADEVEIERNGERKTVQLPENFAGQLIEQGSRGGLFFPRMPFFIGAIPDSSLNADAGIKQKDKVVAINNEEIKYFDEAKQVLDSLKGQTVPIEIERDDRRLQKEVTISEEGKMEVGVALVGFKDLEKLAYYDLKTKSYGFFASIPAGWNKAMGKLGGYIKQFKLIFNPDTGAYKGLGGFGSIGNIFPAQWNWQSFWEITALLSLILAFMNILPIPALDGGHVMFLLYEMVSGREPNKAVLEKAQLIGMVLLLSLLLFANGNDVVRWLQGDF